MDSAFVAMPPALSVTCTVKLGVPGYFRVPTQNADPGFIASLAGVVRRAIGCGPGLCGGAGGRICRLEHVGCPFVAIASRTPPRG